MRPTGISTSPLLDRRVRFRPRTKGGPFGTAFLTLGRRRPSEAVDLIEDTAFAEMLCLRLGPVAEERIVDGDEIKLGQVGAGASATRSGREGR